MLTTVTAKKNQITADPVKKYLQYIIAMIKCLHMYCVKVGQEKHTREQNSIWDNTTLPTEQTVGKDPRSIQETLTAIRYHVQVLCFDMEKQQQ